MTLSFSLSRQTLPVKLDGEDYYLQEASGGEAEEYRVNLLAGVMFDSEGKLTSQNLSGNITSDSLLVSLCIRKGRPDDDKTDDQKKIGIEFIKKNWPDKVISKLADKIKDISGLEKDDEEEKEEVKN